MKAFKNRSIPLPDNFDQKALDLIEKKAIQDSLIAETKKFENEWNKTYCLLSVSRNAKSPVMWAHYAEVHQGIVIGIDFDTLFRENNAAWGIKMHEVEYPPERQKVDVLDDEKENYLKILTTKSSAWRHEKESRSVFTSNSPDANDMTLENLQRRGLAMLKNHNGKETWFLQLNPSAIKQIIFGLYTDESLKLIVKKLIVDLKSVRLYQVRESKNYEFDLDELNLLR